MFRKRGQVSIFVIIAVIIVASVLIYFLLRQEISIEKIPARFEPVSEYFLSCIEENTEIGAEILGAQGGYIYVPEFIPGSEYMPSSSQLDFLGQGIPYWYYVSGNNIIKEQVPSKREMERQLERFIEERIPECDFSDFQEKGFFISLENSKVRAEIKENVININLNLLFTISDGEETIQIRELSTKANTNLGKFYDLALKIYSYEKQNSFLENYAVDVLRLYAPVDGVELSCSPKIWTKQKIEQELKQALEANTQALKLKGSYYTLKDKTNEYFIVDILTGEKVNFLYSSNWPTKIEVEPESEGVLLAEPVGLQPGLGILGFCYVPYHFVYDIVYPVLIQVYDNYELFQFPVSVIVQGNKPRQALPGFAEEQEVELCKYKNQEVMVYTYDSNLMPVEAAISFKCFTERCDIGKTEVKGGDAILSGKFPQCVNGFILAKAEGYETSKLQISTNEEEIANILLDKLYDLDLKLRVGGKETIQQGVIYFESENTEKSKTIVWPEVNSFELSAGLYNVSVFVYTNSSIKIPASSTRKCIEVPKSGLLGVLGRKEERCFNIDFPEQTLSAGIIGGGKSVYYVTESELEKGKLEIDVESLPIPKTLEELQDNYNLLEIKKISLMFG